MEIKCLGSGSSGNSYIVHQEGITYLLDAGVNFRKIVSNINLNELEFCFISHEHKDHSANLENLQKRCVEIIQGNLIQEFTKISSKRVKSGKYQLFAFPIKHGECKNAALIVKTENECLLYATDFSICKYDLKQFKFTHIMVECNFDEELMRKAPKDYKHLRQINTHLGFNGLKTFLSKAVDLTSVEEIILIHLSTEAELVDRKIIMMKAQLEWQHKRIGICKQYGGIDYGSR